MNRQYYEIGETFVDEVSGKTLMCGEIGLDCGECFYFDKKCAKATDCIPRLRLDKKSVCFIDTNTIPDQSELTQQILIDNGWTQVNNDNVFELDKIKIFCVNGFGCGLQTKQNELIGEPFNTVGELKSIASALYKVELEFK